MGFISGFIQASAVLAAQAQQIAGRRRNRQQAVLDQAISDSKKRVREVDGVECSKGGVPFGILEAGADMEATIGEEKFTPQDNIFEHLAVR